MVFFRSFLIIIGMYPLVDPGFVDWDRIPVESYCGKDGENYTAEFYDCWCAIYGESDGAFLLFDLDLPSFRTRFFFLGLWWMVAWFRIVVERNIVVGNDCSNNLNQRDFLQTWEAGTYLSKPFLLPVQLIVNLSPSKYM